MKLAIDLDECVADTFEVDLATCYLYNKRNNLLKKSFYLPVSSHAPRVFEMSLQEEEKFFIEQRKLVIEKKLLRPKYLAKEIINKLYDENNEIIIMTARNDKYWKNAAKESAAWLDENGIKYSKVIANCLNKGQACKENNVDILVDDNLYLIKQANSYGINTITYWSPFNKKYKDKLNVFASCWPEVYDKVKEYEKNKS